MHSLKGNKAKTFSRPKGKIVGKNAHAGRCDAFHLLRPDLLMVGYGSRYVGTPNKTVLYQLPDFTEVESFDGIGDKIDFHKSRSLILGKAEDEDLEHKFGMGIGSLDPLKLNKVVALQGPSFWIQSDEEQDVEFVACVLNWMQVGKVNAANEYLLPVFEKVKEGHRPLLRINHEKKSASLLHDFDVGSSDNVCELIPDLENDTIYYATIFKVGALEFSTGKKKWETELAQDSVVSYDQFHIYGFDLSHDKKFLAIGSMTSEFRANEAFVILDTSSGDFVFRTDLSRRLDESGIAKQYPWIDSVCCWHPAGWCAVGTSAGIIAHITVDGKLRAYKGAGKRIRALEFIDDAQTLLVGSDEKQFRTYSLIEDELG